MATEFSFRRGLARLCFALALCMTTAITQAAGPPQRIIVRYHSTLSAQDAGRAPAQGLASAAGRFGVTMQGVRTAASGAQIVKLDRALEREDLKQLIKELAADPNVAYVEEDVLFRHMAHPNDPHYPNDPQYSQQWHYLNTGTGISAPAAWRMSTGKGVNVAVIDTGYRPHVDLAKNIVGGYDFISDPFVANDGDLRDADAQDPGDWIDPADGCGIPSPSSWHGTHVAGTIAAITNNGVGVAGVAYNARIVPVRVLGRCGGYLSDIADAIIWAAGGDVPGVPANQHPARVLNLSLGATIFCGQTFQHAIASARSRGAAVVVAAGNNNALGIYSTPSSCAGAISVAATGATGARAFYSNFGAGYIDLAAPGGDGHLEPPMGVLSLSNDGATKPGNDTYASYQGTSMAAPHVSGVAALMLAINPSLTPDRLEKILVRTAKPFPGRCSQCGSGIVDAAEAVQAARRR